MLFFGDEQGFVFGLDLENGGLPLHVGAKGVQVELFDGVFERLCLFLECDHALGFAELGLQHLVLGGATVNNRDVDVERNAVRIPVLDLGSVFLGFPSLESGARACAERYLDGLALACDFGVLLRDLDRETVGL